MQGVEVQLKAGRGTCSTCAGMPAVIQEVRVPLEARNGKRTGEVQLTLSYSF